MIQSPPRSAYLGVRIKSLIAPAGAAVVVAVIAFALANHGGGSTTARATATATVTGTAAAVGITNYAFAPQSLTVKVGTRVTWTNHDSTAHTATADQGSLDSGTISPGQSKSIEFSRPGKYPYHCAFHAFMTGTITVVQ
jgi:plastocyanin